MKTLEDQAEIHHPLEENSLITRPKLTTEKLDGFQPQVIFVLGGSISKKSLGIRPTSFKDRDDKGNFAWGKIRAVAAAHLIKRFPDTQLVTLSRSSNEPPEPSDARAMSEEINRFAGKTVNSIELDLPRDTFSELLETLSFSLERQWDRILYLTTAFQQPRVEAMLQSFQNADLVLEQQKIFQMLLFNEHRYRGRIEFTAHFRKIAETMVSGPESLKSLKIITMAAEAVLFHRNRHYLPILADLKGNIDYQAQVQKDLEATRQWQDGIYGKLR